MKVSISKGKVHNFPIPFPELLDSVLRRQRPGSFRLFQLGHDGIRQGAVISAGGQATVVSTVVKFIQLIIRDESGFLPDNPLDP